MSKMLSKSESYLIKVQNACLLIKISYYTKHAHAQHLLPKLFKRYQRVARSSTATKFKMNVG